MSTHVTPSLFNCERRVGALAIPITRKLACVVLMCAVGPAATPAQQPVSPTLGAPSQVGPHTRSWSRPGAGSPVVEMATGMNYFWNGQWLPSNPNFVADPTGFIAAQVQHPTHVSSQLNVAGAVAVTAPVDGRSEGPVFYSTPVGIGLYDPVSGAFETIGVVTNSTGVMTATNAVLFQNAFQGVCADYLVSIEQGRVSADVIFTGSINPADYGFNPTNAQIQIINEVYQAPTPDVLLRPLSIATNATVRTQWASPDIIDETLGFSDLVFASGRAFTMENAATGTVDVAPVWKTWQTNADGRVFLVESLSYWRVVSALASLPTCQPPGGALHGSLQRGKNLGKAYASIPKPAGQLVAWRRGETPKEAAIRTGHGQSASNQQPKPILLAKSEKLPRGLWVDWIATIGGSLGGTIVFDSTTNYFVSSAVYCNGATTIMGGTIFKYKVGASITFNSSLTCQGSMYRPITCTGVDDDTVGDSLNGWPNSGYTGHINSSGYANPALAVYGSPSLSNFHFRYAQVAIANNGDPNGINLTVQDSQFVNCIKGISIIASGSGSGSGGSGAVALYNSLMASVTYPFYFSGVGAGYTYYCTVASSTFDHGTYLASSDGSANINSYNSLYSSILISGTGSGSFANNGFYSASAYGSGTKTSSSNPYQSAGAGNYYLASGSLFRTVGTTTGLPTALLSDLKLKTVDPPMIVSSELITNSQVLYSQAQRDTGLLSWGYHYDPIDWALGCVLVTNATVTATNGGTVIATFGTGGGTYGLGLGQGSSFQCVGLANAPNWIVQYNTVQEQPITNWYRTSYGSVVSEFQGLRPAAVINCHFTHWSVLSLDAPQFYGPTNTGPIVFKDCEFYGGKVLSAGPTLNLTNCLLSRVYADIEPTDGLWSYLRNCLVYGGNFSFGPTNSLVQDCLFDKATITNLIGGHGNTYTGGFNAYVNGYNRLQPTNSNDIILSASPSYQTGPLGNFYLLSSSGLINKDTSTTADQVGLYHYTVMNTLSGGLEIKETNSLVDISYHWVATDSAGNPIDTSGDTVPDYLRDPDGNGVVDNGEISWLTYTSPNGLTSANGLEVFTPLK